MRTQRLLFVHPWIPARFNGTPMGLLYLATLARVAGHDVKIVDLQAEGPEFDFPSLLNSFRPTVVAVSSTSPSHKKAMELLRLTKSYSHEIVTVSGGVHETYCAADTLAYYHQVDYTFLGECDLVFVGFLDTLHDKTELQKTPGLGFRDYSTITINPQSTSKIELDSLPIPDRSLLHSAIPYNFRIFDYSKTTQVQTMRGCPYQCSFCNQRNRNPLVRSAESVSREFGVLREQGYEGVFFDDATFTMDKKRTIELMDTMISNNSTIDFACQTRVERVDRELLEKMALAGCSYISFGFESADPEALKSVLKVSSVELHLSAVKSAVSGCHNEGIRSCLNLIVGFPGETNDRIKYTLEHVRSLNPTFISISALAKYPHEDPSLSGLYRSGVSQEPIWQDYDEGYGAFHPFLDAGRAEEILELARSELGDMMGVV